MPESSDYLLSFAFVSQVRELEVDLDNETRRNSETMKNAKKTERRLKDMCQQQEEDQKNLQNFKDQVDRLNKKVKSTKSNQEEAVCPLSSVFVLSPAYPSSFSSVLLYVRKRLLFSSLSLCSH